MEITRERSLSARLDADCWGLMGCFYSQGLNTHLMAAEWLQLGESRWKRKIHTHAGREQCQTHREVHTHAIIPFISVHTQIQIWTAVWIFSRRFIKREGVIRINYLLNFTFPDTAFIQILNELLSLHPVDERTHIPAVAEERSASQVHRAAWKTHIRQVHINVISVQTTSFTIWPVFNRCLLRNRSFY